MWVTEASDLWDEDQVINLQDEERELHGAYIVIDMDMQRFEGVDQYFTRIRKFGESLPDLPVHIVFPYECDSVKVH